MRSIPQTFVPDDDDSQWYQLPKFVRMRSHARRITLAGLAIMALTSSTAAQDLDPVRESPYTPGTHERIHWGLRAGLNLSIPHFGGGPPANLDPVPSLGWSAGAMAQFKLSAHWAVLAEAGYSRRVNQLVYDSVGSENRLALNLLETAFQVRRRFALPGSRGATSNLYVGLGPNISYWMSGSGTNQFNGIGNTYQVHFDESPAMQTSDVYISGANRWLVGVDLAVGVAAPIYEQKIFIELRGTLGLTPLGSSGSTSASGMPGYSGSELERHLLSSTLWTASLNVSYTLVHNPMKSKLGKSTREETKKKNPSRKKKDNSYLNTRIKTPKK